LALTIDHQGHKQDYGDNDHTTYTGAKIGHRRCLIGIGHIIILSVDPGFLCQSMHCLLCRFNRTVTSFQADVHDPGDILLSDRRSPLLKAIIGYPYMLYVRETSFTKAQFGTIQLATIDHQDSRCRFGTFQDTADSPAYSGKAEHVSGSLPSEQTGCLV
jgi:hypothetical protein